MIELNIDNDIVYKLFEVQIKITKEKLLRYNIDKNISS